MTATSTAVRAVVAAGLAIGAIGLLAATGGCESERRPTATKPAQPKGQPNKTGGIQVQEKYGVAPVGEE